MVIAPAVIVIFLMLNVIRSTENDVIMDVIMVYVSCYNIGIFIL